MLSKIDKKKKLLENNNNVLQILEDTNEKYIKFEKEKSELTESIRDINDNDYPFNPDCKCCQAQPWRLMLVDLENKLVKCNKKLEGINKKIIITRGEKGSVSISNGKVVEYSAHKDLKIIDLTGAGDLFAAGYLHGYIDKLPLIDCLIRGTELSSKIIQQVGARIK